MAFATAEDVGARLLRDLTTAETSAAEYAIATVTGLIADEVSRDATWAAALSPVPAMLKALCVEKAVGVLVNPQNVAQASEQVGSYNWSQTFPRSSDLGLFLSDAESRAVRFAVYGTNSGSARMTSFVDTALDLADDGELNDSLGS